MWYDSTPAEHAKWLRFRAAENDASEARWRARQSKEPWAAGEADFFRGQARRLRAMALLCERSTAPRVGGGGVDFRGLSDPTQPLGVRDAVVAEIETA